MLRLASAVIRFCLGSAIVVALVAIGVVLASSLPEVGQTESCELKSPYLIADGGKSLDQRFAVVVDPAGCELGMPEGQTIQLSLTVIHGSVLQQIEFQDRMTPDGSLHTSLPVDPKHTSGQVHVEIFGSVPGCENDGSSCAAWIHEL